MMSSFPKVHLQVCCRGGEIPGLQRNAWFSVGCRLTPKRNNHKRGKHTRSGLRNPETTSAGVDGANPVLFVHLAASGRVDHGDGSHGVPLPGSRSSLNQAHLERGKAEPTEAWLHLEQQPGRWSHDIGGIYSERKFLHEPNMYRTHARPSRLPAQQNLLRHHFAAAGQMLGLFLGLFLKTLISSPLFPSQLIDSWNPLQHGRLIITSLTFVRRPSFDFFFPVLTAGDVTSAATEIKVKLLVVTWVSSLMSLVDMCNNTPLLQCNKEVDCFLTALGLPHLGRLLEKAFL